MEKMKSEINKWILSLIPYRFIFPLILWIMMSFLVYNLKLLGAVNKTEEILVIISLWIYLLYADFIIGFGRKGLLLMSGFEGKNFLSYFSMLLVFIFISLTFIYFLMLKIV